MAAPVASIDTAHEDMIHDAQLDFYGKRLATCSSDRTVRIFEVQGGQHTLLKELRGHEGPVWQVAWAHPKFGNLIASASYDNKVIVWKETPAGWENVYEHKAHQGSVNTVAWAPHEYETLTLACGSSDGDITILTCQDGQWSYSTISGAHTTGVTSVSWAPAASAGASMQEESVRGMTLVSGGCDNTVRIWAATSTAWEKDTQLSGHTDWVRDVAWAPSIGLTTSTIASCGQDGKVLLWTQSKSSEAWDGPVALPDFNTTVWRVSWSITGNVLAVSAADNKVTLWKQALDGNWQNVGEVNEPVS